MTAHLTTRPTGALDDAVLGARGWVVDVDGCLMSTDSPGGAGGTAMPDAAAFLASLRRDGARFVVCTNASERPPADYARSLRAAGLDVADDEFVTAGSAAADHVVTHHPGAAVVAVGAPGLTEPVTQRGADLVDPASGRLGDVVVVGAASTYTSAAMNAAALSVAAGAPLYVTVDRPWFHGGRGRSVCKSAVVAQGIAWATGAPVQVLGKPSPALAQTLLAHLGVPADEVTVVGDADIEVELARHMGARSVLVLSGGTTPGEVAALAPDVVLDDVAALHRARLRRTPRHSAHRRSTPRVP